MLQAILRRKARWENVFEGEDSEANKIRLKEDTLTAMVFGRLVYLPSDVLWKLILCTALPRRDLPAQVGAIEDVQFWPEWKIDRALKIEKTRVEPDVLIRFSGIDVVVEAKRGDEEQQYAQQLGTEWLAWRHSESEGGRRCIVLAVGGVGHLTEEKALTLRSSVHDFLVEHSTGEDKPPIFATSWASLLNELLHLQEIWCDEYQTQSASFLLVVKDVIAALDLHKFYPRCWLSDLHSVAACLLGLEGRSLKSLEAFELAETGISFPSHISGLLPIQGQSLRTMRTIEVPK